MKGLQTQVPTHPSVDIRGSRDELGLLSRQGLESGHRKQAQALAAFVGQLHGLEGAEGLGRVFVAPC